MLLLFIASYSLLRLVERAECFSAGNSIARRPVVQQQQQHVTLALGGSISFINDDRRKYNNNLHPAAFCLNSVSDTDTDTSISIDSSASGMDYDMESSKVSHQATLTAISGMKEVTSFICVSKQNLK